MALGLRVRTGKAAVVAVRGPAIAPAVVAKAIIQVAFTFEEGAVFHAAQEMPIAQARAHVERAEGHFKKVAQKKLAAFVENHRLHVHRADVHRLRGSDLSPDPLHVAATRGEVARSLG